MTKPLKWMACLVCMIGVGLTSFNIYPLNLVISAAGTALWLAAGLLSKDIPLYLGETLHLIVYLSGLITWAVTRI